MRFIILILLAYAGYRLIKRLFAFPLTPKQGGSGDRAGIDDIMIKDPFCKVYFPRRQGIRATVKGVEYYFCSKECRDKFIAQHKAQD